MTPFAALHTLSRTWADLHELPVLVLCLDCEKALLRELDGMFTPVEGPHRLTLRASQVMGFTFDQGPPETCALHDMLREDAACP